jgi:hypothetical protein
MKEQTIKSLRQDFVNQPRSSTFVTINSVMSWQTTRCTSKFFLVMLISQMKRQLSRRKRISKK